MRRRRFLQSIAWLLVPPIARRVRAQDLLLKLWSARWIAVPDTSASDYGVYHFRRTFDLEAAPSTFVVHVSADNRYELFVNGTRVANGPARGDLNHWRYETVDIAPHLRPGSNIVAALVWNAGEAAPEAQVTNRTAFLLQGNSAAERVLDTNAQWLCTRDEAYRPLLYSHAQMRGYFVAGPADEVDGARYPWGWQTREFDAAAWKRAYSDPRWNGAPRDGVDAPNRWLLVPRTIPPMEERRERLASVREASGVTPPAAFPREAAAFSVPANTRARLLLDQSHLTTAYPEFAVSGGAGAVIRASYAESLFVDPKSGNEKGNRNEVAGKTFVGYSDVFKSDGGASRVFRPLWWRTYRYLQLEIATAAEPLTIDDVRGVFTAYPFQMKARLDTGSERIAKFLDIGWRTARLCAHETYMDCPYYEQLQYVGDTRIQALVSYYNAGDGRLARNAIAQINDSRTAEGATMSRAPTRQQQYIPTFSLWWIGMLHDYWRYQNDAAFVRDMLPGARDVLGFFLAHFDASGTLTHLPWWNFIDWAWRDRGMPPRDANGSSACFDLLLLLALDWAADLEQAIGSKPRGGEWRASASALRSKVREHYWDTTRQLFADTPEKKNFSQHANVLAVLAHVVDGTDARALLEKVLSDKSLTQCTFYFRHYLHTAVNQVGLGDRFLDLLGDWDAMLERGLTTWAETPEPTRSDCHAWSASPNFELFRTVLGIDSAAPGFARISIRPFLGKLTRVSGSIPHPAGEVAVALSMQPNGRLSAEVNLPEGTAGEFHWRGIRRELPAGRSMFTV
jgi:alpha-L-rhamnosidase